MVCTGVIWSSHDRPILPLPIYDVIVCASSYLPYDCLSISLPLPAADLSLKSKRALKGILAQCTAVPPLQALLTSSPVNILRLILQQFALTLPTDPAARRHLVGSGGLKTLQELRQRDQVVLELVDELNQLFPADVVEYCTPEYEATLTQKVTERLSTSGR